MEKLGKMEDIKANLVRWQIVGTLFVLSFGGILHFLFAWSGGWTPVALVAAVNESVWEHLKLVFWPGLIFVFATYPILKNKTENFWTAKISGLLSMPLCIVALFYLYKFIFKTHNLAYDIGIFILAVILGQWISCRLLLQSPPASKVKFILIVTLLAAITAFSLFSFFPPPYPLFQDSHSGGYGIQKTRLR
jgi:hypothetical protein